VDTLLLVEDELLVALPVEDALMEAGFQVELRTSGEDALAVLEADALKFVGLITDIRLGGQRSGWDVAKRARELIPEVPVVYVSGDSSVNWAAEGVPHSIMISKPYALVEVTAAIGQLLDKADLVRT
jgi:DNA-binding response OmpR family regulator